MEARKNPFLEWALFYALERHWPVFPLAPKTKIPFAKTNGCNDATTNEKQIREWWKDSPKANIGLRQGIATFVVDRDKEGEDTYALLVQKHGRFADTLQACTPNDGIHMVYLWPGNGIHIGTHAPARKDWPGIDIRGEGGYIAVHPSIVKNDAGIWKRYEWDGVDGELDVVRSADPWLIEAIRERDDPAEKPHHNDNGHFVLPEKIRHDDVKEQHDVLCQYIGQLISKRLSKDEVFQLAWKANLDRCEKPGPEKDIWQYVDSLWKKDQKKRDAAVPGPAHQPAPTHAPVVFTRKRFLDTYQADYPALKPLIEPILYPGLTILGGRPKMGKTWFALQLALAISNQQQFANYFPIDKKYRILYLSLEDTEPQFHRRLHRLVPNDSFFEFNDVAYELAPLMDGGAEQLDETLTAKPVDLLFVDSLLAAVQQTHRKNQDIMQADYNIVRKLRDVTNHHNLSTVLVAHTRKAAGDFVDVIQGTTGTTAAADAVWVMQRTNQGKVTLSVTGREVPTNVFSLTRAQDSPAWVVTGEGDSISQSDRTEDILNLLRDNGPCKATYISNTLRFSLSDTYRILGGLLEQRLIIKSSSDKKYQIAPAPPVLKGD